LSENCGFKLGLFWRITLFAGSISLLGMSWLKFGRPMLVEALARSRTLGRSA
jgi:hypothetical protein